jgi:hypothetical protein
MAGGVDDSDMQDAASDVSQFSEDEVDAILDAAFDQLVDDVERQVRAEALAGRAYGSALHDNTPAGGSARGQGPRTPRYLDPASGLGGTSQWRRDYTNSILREHIGAKQVLSGKL